MTIPKVRTSQVFVVKQPKLTQLQAVAVLCIERNHAPNFAPTKPPKITHIENGLKWKYLDQDHPRAITPSKPANEFAQMKTAEVAANCFRSAPPL